MTIEKLNTLVAGPRYECLRGVALWYTGLPSSGKTTVAIETKAFLETLSLPVVVLDGDVIRPIIAADIDYSPEGRRRSLDRYVQLSKVLIQSRIIVMVVVNNHSQEQREVARRAHPEGQFIEIWVDTPLDLCMQRDVKGLYARAKRGEVTDLVGVTIKYEPPRNPDIVITTDKGSLSEESRSIFSYLKAAGIIAPVLKGKT